MLRHLAIKDFAVVRAAELEFGEGMTVISGETGAGKSLLVDALGFLSGLRADSGVVRHGAERAELSAEFSAPSGSPAQAWLADNELDDEGQCQLRRVIRADGGSRAWINGRSVTLSQLTDLAGRLVEIHGQHEHQALLARNSQLDLLDAFARNDAERARVRDAARAWSALLHEREQLSGQGDVSDRINYLEHQLAELQREDLSPAALEQLVASHRRQAHATGLIQACDAALGQLAGDDTPSLTRQLQQVRADLARQAEHEPRLRDVDGLLDGAAIQIEEALSLLGQVRDDLDAEPLQFDALERKLARVHDLARKHRVPLEGLQEQHDRLAAELDGLRGAGERLLKLNDEIGAARQQWRDAAGALSRTRQRAARALGDTTTALIAELGMGGGRFEIALEPQDGERPDPTGAERVEFLVSANAGQPPRALRKVASGGELSRIMLSFKSVLADLDGIPTMVFDEIDSGISGQIGTAVAVKMRQIAKNHQVLCITHLPQIAAYANHQYLVYKEETGEHTRSNAIQLTQQQRAREIARIMGSSGQDAVALEHAQQLIDAAEEAMRRIF